jgi:hypothetical protein
VEGDRTLEGSSLASWDVLLCVKSTKEAMTMIAMKMIYKKEKKRRILRKLNRGKRKREGNSKDKSMVAVFSCEYNI